MANLSASEMRLLAEGATLAGYRVQGRLARGGGAEVHLLRAEGDGTARYVAKVVDGRDLATVRLLADEARLLLELPLAALPAVAGWLPPARDGVAALILELRAGMPLNQALAARNNVPSLGYHLLAQALAALQAIHAAGVVHGDLHAGNLLVDDAGRLSLLDLGLAAPIGSAAAGPGLPEVAAPERLRGELADPRDDLFALGMALWRGLGLPAPYADYPAVLPSESERALVEPSDPRAPLLRLLSQLLRPARSQRPADAEAALRSLRSAADEAGVALHDDPEASLRALDGRPFAARALPASGADAASAPWSASRDGDLLIYGVKGSGRSAALRAIALGERGSSRMLRPQAWLQGSLGGRALGRLEAEVSRWTAGPGPARLRTLPPQAPVEGGLGGGRVAEQARFDAALDAVLAGLGSDGLLLVDDLDQLPTPLAEAVLHRIDGGGGARCRVVAASEARPALAQCAVLPLQPQAEAVTESWSALLRAADGGRAWDLALVRGLARAVDGVIGRLWPAAAALSATGIAQRSPDRVDAAASGPGLDEQIAGVCATLAAPEPPPASLLGLLAHLLVDREGLRGDPADPAPPMAPEESRAWPWLRQRPGGGVRLDPAAAACLRRWLIDASATSQIGQAAMARAGYYAPRSPDRALELQVIAAGHGVSAPPAAADVLAALRARQMAGDGAFALELAQRWLELPTALASGAPVPARVAIWTLALQAATSLGAFAAVDALLALRPLGADLDVDALLAEAEAAFRRGAFADARAQAEGALRACGADPAQLGDWSRPAVLALLLRSFAATWQGDLQEARAGVASGLVTSSPWPELRAQNEYLDALLHYYGGNLEAARAAFAALVAGHIADAITAAAHAGLGLCAQRAGDLGAARQAYDESRRLAELAGDRARALNMTMNIATLDHEAGDLGRALAGYDRVVAVADRLGIAGTKVRAQINRGNLRWLLGASDDAADDLDAVLPALHTTGNAYAEGNVACVHAEMARSAGRLDAASAWIARAEAALTAVGASSELGEIRLEAGWLALTRGDLDAAARTAEQIEGDALAHGGQELTARALHLRARVAMARLLEPSLPAREAARLVDSALGQLADAADRLPAGKVIASIRVDADRAWLLAASGRVAESARVAEGARERLQRLGASLPLQHQRRFAAAPTLAAVRDVLGLCGRLGALGTPSDAPASLRSAERVVLSLAQRLSAEHDPARLLETLMDSAVTLTGAERGFLLLDARPGEPTTSPSAADLEVAVARNLDGENLKKPQHKLSRGMAIEVFESGEPLLATDARMDPRFAEQASVHAGNLRSIVCVPLILRGRTIGVLYVDNRFAAGAFAREHGALLEALASQAAVAIHTARLITRLRQQQQQLEQSRAEVVALNGKLEAELASTEDALSEARRQLVSERGEAARRVEYDQIRGESAAIHRMFRIIDRVRDHDFPVLVIGESGTGKELVARAIHGTGRRKAGPFVAINCGALPENLLESELFGHVRGAFTGAVGDRRGLFEQAHGGTLFLDEIGEMPPSMQVKLLRVLQTGELTRVGGAGVIQVDVRVVAATHRDLDKMVRDGGFREDLLYRLRVVDIQVPPLRSRLPDLELLCDHFLQRNRDAGLGRVRRITKGAMQRMRAYAWPGNVRELETFLKSACLFAEGDTLDVPDVEPVLERATGTAMRRTGGEVEASAAPEGTLADIERAAILARLGRLQGNKRQAAESLGIDRSTLYHKLRAYGLAGDGN